MKKIILSSLLTASVMLGASTDLDNLAIINDIQMKPTIWHMWDKTYDTSIIKEQEKKRFFISLIVTKPFVANIIIEHFQMKNCKDDLSFFNNTSINEIKDFVNSKPYETLLSYAYEKPAYYQNISNNTRYFMCGKGDFISDINTILDKQENK